MGAGLGRFILMLTTIIKSVPAVTAHQKNISRKYKNHIKTLRNCKVGEKIKSTNKSMEKSRDTEREREIVRERERGDRATV